MKKIKMTERWVDPKTFEIKTRTKEVEVGDSYSPKSEYYKMRKAIAEFKVQCQMEANNGNDERPVTEPAGER